MEKQNNILSFKNIKFEMGEEHLNKMPFSGICMPVGTASSNIPCGSDIPVIFEREAVDKALETIVGMGVDCVFYASPNANFAGHDTQFKIGVITKAEVRPEGVYIEGYIWRKDFPAICNMIQDVKESLGFSVEVCVYDAEEQDEQLVVKDFTFTGVAILYKTKAAFAGTQLAASKKESEGDSLMDEKQMKELMDKIDGISVAFSAAIAPIKADVEKLNGVVDGLVKKDGEKQDGEKLEFSTLESKIAELEKELAETKVAPVVQTKTVKVVQENGNLTFSQKIAEVDSDVTLSEQAKVAKKMSLWAEARKAV